MNLRFVAFLMVSAVVHTWLLWFAEATTPPSLPLARGEISVELTYAAVPQPMEEEQPSRPPREVQPEEFQAVPLSSFDESVTKTLTNPLQPQRARVVEDSDAFNKMPDLPARILTPHASFEYDKVSRVSVEPIRLSMAKAERADPPAASTPVVSAASTDRSQGVQVQAQLLGTEKPTYPSEAHRRGLEGRVVLRLHVSAAGSVDEAYLEESSGHAILDNHTLRYAKNLRFAPARHGENPVPSTVLLPVRFRLVDNL